MIISPSTIAAAKRNGSNDLARGSAPPGERLTRVDEVVDLLANSTSPAAQPGARDLLQQMAATAWNVVRGLHSSPDDGSPHVTVAIGRTRYHLRLDGKGCVFDITCYREGETQRPAGAKPWAPPGA